MVAIHADSAPNPTPTAIAPTPRNPYLVGLLVVAGLAWLVAFMLWIVLAQVTDFTPYNVDDAAALATWIDTLILGGVVAAVGAMVVGGVRRELRVTTRA